jgi:Tfp pilus assembly protein PilF
MHKTKIILISALVTFFAPSAAPAVGNQNLDSAFENARWSEVADLAYKTLAKDPSVLDAKWKGAFALFKKNYPYAAMQLLQKVTPSEWSTLGYDRLAVLLWAEAQMGFRGDDGLSFSADGLPKDFSADYRDEISFAAGKRAFDGEHWQSARDFFSVIPPTSIYFAAAKSYAGCAALKLGDHLLAAKEFSAVVDSPEPVVPDSAKWQASAAKMWGWEGAVVSPAEPWVPLAKLALARLKYGAGDYENAAGLYETLLTNGKTAGLQTYLPDIQVENTWTLLQLKTDAANRSAMDLSERTMGGTPSPARWAGQLQNIFASIRLKKFNDARRSIGEADRKFDAARATLQGLSQWTSDLPDFLKAKTDPDSSLKNLQAQVLLIQKERDRLIQEDTSLFPGFASLRADLDVWASQLENGVHKKIAAHAAEQMSLLNELQSKLKLASACIFLNEKNALAQPRSDPDSSEENAQAKADAHFIDEKAALIHSSLEALTGVNDNPDILFTSAELSWELAELTPHGLKSPTLYPAPSLKKRAVDLATTLVSKFPHFSKRRDALYFIALAQFDAGQFSAAKKNVIQFLDLKSENDEEVAGAQLMLGEISFNEGKLDDAQGAFGKVLALGDNASAFRGYAFYKVGWCGYYEQNFGRALVAFEKAYQWAAANSTAPDATEIARQSRNDLIRVFAEVGDHKKALEYFRRFLREASRGWMSDLAAEYEKRGEIDQAIDIYHDMLALNPSATESLMYRTSLLKAEYKLRRWDAVLRETVDLITAHGAALANPTVDGPPAFLAESMLHQIVEGEFAELSKGANRTTITPEIWTQEAAAYLKAFGKWPGSKDIWFGYATILASTNHPTEALAAYRTLWEQFQRFLKEPDREQALLGLVGALERREREEPTDVTAEKPKPQVLSESARELIEQALDYQTLYPRGSKIRSVAFLRSAIYFKYGQTEKGIRESQYLFDANPKDEIGAKAFKDLRVAYYEQKNWERTYRWAVSLSLRNPVQVGNYLEDLRTIRDESLFLWAEGEPDAKRAGNLFMKAAAEARDPHGAFREKCLFNAFQKFTAANQRADAFSAIALLSRDFPQSARIDQTRAAQSVYYQEAGDYQKALPLLEAFVGGRSPASAGENEGPAKDQARLNAALIEEAYGNFSAALNYFKQLSSSNDPKIAAAVRAGLSRTETKLANSGETEWNQLLDKKRKFEQSPLGKKGVILARLQKGGEVLETLSKNFVDFSNRNDISKLNSYEAFCALPGLYDAFSRAVTSVAGSADADVKNQLRAVESPLVEKARTLARQCLDRSYESGNLGPQFFGVAERYGWENKTSLKERSDRVLPGLEIAAPFLDPVTDLAGEAAILDKQIKNLGDEASWYALARIRMNQEKWALARLTLEQALAKFPKSGKILNAMAYVDQRLGIGNAVVSVYERAAQAGAVSAWANLGFYYLKAAKPEQAIIALDIALKDGVFDKNPSVKSLIQELIKNDKTTPHKLS